MELNKKVRLNRGWLVLAVVIGVPMFGWLVGYDFSGLNFSQAILLTLAKVGAFGGTAMFAVSLILSGRYVSVEKLFGGLDKVYIAHRFLGTFSLVLLLIHPLALTFLRLSKENLGSAVGLWLDVANVGVVFGMVSLYSLLGLVIWSLYAKTKYETFVKVHRFLGISFVIGASHAFIAGSVLAQNTFMSFYLLVLTIVASVSYVMYTAFHDLLHLPAKYQLVSVEKHPDGILNLSFTPVNRIINFVPGQFVYVMFDDFKEQGYHPLSISSSRDRSTLSVSVRMIGDFTKSLSRLEPGAKVMVKGPHGNFLLNLKSKQKQLWIAGGIGVTPFLSGALSLPRSDQKGQVQMLYATGDSYPFGADILQQVEESNEAFNFMLFAQSQQGFISFKVIEGLVPDYRQRKIYICGPPPMLNGLREQAEQGGFADQLVYEEFSY